MSEGHSLRAIGVSRSFAGVRALDGVSIAIGRREVVGLIGPNGSGKTTLVNLLSGYDRPDQGSISLDGVDISTWSPHKRCHRGLSRTFQHGRLYRGLTARENVEVAALANGLHRQDARATADRLLERLGLAERADQPAAVLPHGDERRLGLARALATNPTYLLMDEPAAGLNEGEVPALAETIRAVADADGCGVLLIDHNMGLVMRVCDRVQVVVDGATLVEGTPNEVRTHPAVAEAYLGRRVVR